MGRTDERGDLPVASLIFFFAISVLAAGKYYQYALGFLRVAAFLAAGVLLWNRGRATLHVSPYILLLCGFSVLSLGHSFSSVYVWVSLQHALNILLATTLFVLVLSGYSAGKSPRAWQWFLPVLAALTSAELAVACVQRVTTGTTRPHGTFSNPMFLSEFLAVTALFFTSRFVGEWKKSGRGRAAWGMGAVLSLAAALVLTGSRGVIVALVPAMVVLAIAHFGVARGAKAFLLALPGLAVLGWHSVSRFFTPDIYNYGRWVFWRSALRVFESNPFGVGLGGYKYHWFTTQGPFLEAFRHYAKSPVTPHNEYLEVLTGLGFVGLILFSAVLLIPLWYAARGWNDVPEDRRWTAAGAIAGLVLTGTNALFNFNFHEFGVVFTDVLLLGILWSSLPESVFGRTVAIHPAFSRTGAVFAILLGLVSLTLLCGTVALGRGESLVREKRYDSAETAFRTAMRLDPLRATIPDALSALYYRRFVVADQERSAAADELLLSSIRWQGKAMELCPREQGFPFRLANLFIERYRRSGDRGDLETVLLLSGEILRDNPYLVEGFWIRALALMKLGRTADAAEVLRRSVSIEPNFCRGYAKLAELTAGNDGRQARAYEARALECRESAKQRPLEEGERWLVTEPGTSMQD